MTAGDIDGVFLSILVYDHHLGMVPRGVAVIFDQVPAARDPKPGVLYTYIVVRRGSQRTDEDMLAIRSRSGDVGRTRLVGILRAQDDATCAAS